MFWGEEQSEAEPVLLHNYGLDGTLEWFGQATDGPIGSATKIVRGSIQNVKYQTKMAFNSRCWCIYGGSPEKVK